MNQFWKEVSLAGVMGIVIPGILMGAAVSLMDKEPEVLPTEPAPVVQETQALAEPDPIMIPVLGSDGEIIRMELNGYLTGVVLAEMPASFETEALKAQAVVARTYAIRAWERGRKHEDAAVCMNPACCQGYTSEEQYMARGGTAENVEKIRNAVNATGTDVLTYDGELIEATYFSCSGGSTEDAVAVWGTDVPYLQAVESPGEEGAVYYSDTVTYKAENFAVALGMKLTGDPANWLGAVEYTDGGGVASMVIGGVTFKGTTLRSALGLRSTAFTIETSGNIITITTRGYGHRVGMSQYGADAMAVSGSTCAEILTYYYQGTELRSWID